MESVLFEVVLKEIKGMSWSELCEVSDWTGLTPEALFFWQQGVVTSPRVGHVEIVLEYFGYHIPKPRRHK